MRHIVKACACGFNAARRLTWSVLLDPLPCGVVPGNALFIRTTDSQESLAHRDLSEFDGSGEPLYIPGSIAEQRQLPKSLENDLDCERDHAFHAGTAESQRSRASCAGNNHRGAGLVDFIDAGQQ